MLKCHSERVTAMAFHPLASHVLISCNYHGAIQALSMDAEFGAIGRNVRPRVVKPTFSGNSFV